jgi:hypothetical protein
MLMDHIQGSGFDPSQWIQSKFVDLVQILRPDASFHLSQGFWINPICESD